MRALQITKATRAIVAERSNDTCEVCGQEEATQMHHRRPRGMGGSRDARIHQPSMLLHLGNDCHHYIEHNRDEALDEGWLVKNANDDRPVRAQGRYVRFDDDGGFTGFGPEKPVVEHVLGCSFWTSDVCDGGCAA